MTSCPLSSEPTSPSPRCLALAVQAAGRDSQPKSLLICCVRTEAALSRWGPEATVPVATLPPPDPGRLQRLAPDFLAPCPASPLPQPAVWGHKVESCRAQNFWPSPHLPAPTPLTIGQETSPPIKMGPCPSLQRAKAWPLAPYARPWTS